MASGMSGGRLRLLGAPWSAPAWMKSNGRMSGEGQLKGDLDGPYYRAYAAYLKKSVSFPFHSIWFPFPFSPFLTYCRFFDEYAKRGVHFWALTIQNQPESGLEEIPFQNMFLSNHSQRFGREGKVEIQK
jgi:glucosylceramidase